jgi:hypothetical protein
MNDTRQCQMLGHELSPVVATSSAIMDTAAGALMMPI